MSQRQGCPSESTVIEVVVVNIGYFREKAGMSLHELALGSGLAPEFLEQALINPGILSLADLEAIARKLGVQFTDLLTERDR